MNKRAALYLTDVVDVIFLEGICDNRFSGVEDVIFLKEVSARLRKVFTTCAVTRLLKIIIYGLRANLERVLEVVGELIFALKKLNEHV